MSAARHAIGKGWHEIYAASLDHALWIHRPFRSDEWLLIAVRPLTVAGARGLAIGQVYTPDRAHCATFLQEGLVREITR